MGIMLHDNIKARVLKSDGTYVKKPLIEPFIDSQTVFMDEVIKAQKEKPEQKEPKVLDRLKNIFGNRLKRR